MGFYFRRNLFRSHKQGSSRNGFTLLETMIAVALMLIISSIVYKGFMSSMQYSGNTAMFEKTAQQADEDANLAFGAGNIPGGTTDEGLYLADASGTYNQVIRVNTYDVKLTPSLPSGNPAYYEGSQTRATNRFAFHYVVRPCTVAACGGTIRFYQVGTTVVARCDKCDKVYDSNVS